MRKMGESAHGEGLEEDGCRCDTLNDGNLGRVARTAGKPQVVAMRLCRTLSLAKTLYS